MERKLASIQNKKYGTWTIVSDIIRNKWNKKSVLCRCDCGSELLVELSKLNQLNTCKSCYNNRRKNISPTRKQYKADYYQRNKETIDKKKKKPTKEETRKYGLKYNYGLTLEDVEAYFIIQKGVCYICGSKIGNGGRRMVIDHDHSTGNVRSLLCHNCNVGLGYFKENVLSLERAIKYIKNEI